MQNTRLNRLVDGLLDESGRWIQNPWRRTSLLIISLLFGNFLATALSTVSGQRAEWDVAIAAILTALTELSNWFVYGINRPVQVDAAGRRTRFSTEFLNALKIGLVYGLFLEAFKLGS